MYCDKNLLPLVLQEIAKGTTDKEIAEKFHISLRKFPVIRHTLKLYGLEACQLLVEHDKYPNMGVQYINNVCCRILKDDLSYLFAQIIFMLPDYICRDSLKKLKNNPELLKNCHPEPYPKGLIDCIHTLGKDYILKDDDNTYPFATALHPWLAPFQNISPTSTIIPEDSTQAQTISAAQEPLSSTQLGHTESELVTPAIKESAPQVIELQRTSSQAMQDPKMASNIDSKEVASQAIECQDSTVPEDNESASGTKLEAASLTDPDSKPYTLGTATSSEDGELATKSTQNMLDEEDNPPTFAEFSEEQENSTMDSDELSLEDILEDMDIYGDTDIPVTFSPQIAPISASNKSATSDALLEPEAQPMEDSVQGATSEGMASNLNIGYVELEELPEGIKAERDPIARANMQANLLMAQEHSAELMEDKEQSFDHNKLHIFGIDAASLNALLMNNIRSVQPVIVKNLPQRFVILGGAKNNALRAKNLAQYHVVAVFNSQDPNFVNLCHKQARRTQKQLKAQEA